MPASWEQLRIRTAGRLVVVGGIIPGLPPGPTRGAAVIHLWIARMPKSDPWGGWNTTPCHCPSLTPLAVAYRTGDWSRVKLSLDGHPGTKICTRVIRI